MPPRALPSSSERLGVCGGRAGIPPGVRGAYLRETEARTYGRRPAYLRETRVRTYGRRPAYLRETIFARSHSSTNTSAFETVKKTVQQTPHTVSCVGHTAFGRKGAPPWSPSPASPSPRPLGSPPRR